MTALPSYNPAVLRYPRIRLATALGVLLLTGDVAHAKGPGVKLLLALFADSGSVTGQTQMERFWLAGRYDGNRVVVYFDKVKFNGTMSRVAKKIPPPVADGFFSPDRLPSSYLARFLTGPAIERFRIGDRYDVLTDGGSRMMTVTTLVGCETDEEVGNDSFIGALGTVQGQHALFGTNNYYVVRRHQPSQHRSLTDRLARHASLSDEAVRSDIQASIAEQLTARLKTEATEEERMRAEGVQPSLKVQPFYVADGSLRYYVRAEWRSGKEPNNVEPFALAAWMATRPTLQIVAVEGRTSPYGFENALPRLKNVIDLGNGKTAVIVLTSGLDSVDLTLAEYRDGVDLRRMRKLQSISTAE